MEKDKESVNIKLERYLWPDEMAQQRKQKRTRIILIAAVVVAFLLGYLGGNLVNSPNQNEFRAANPTQHGENTPPKTNILSNKFDQVYDILTHDWYFSNEMENPSQEIMDNAITGMIEKNGDIHTEYFTAEELTEFEESINQDFVGIGVQYYQVNGYPIIQKVFKDSPADKAGIKAGDIIVQVDNQSVVDISTAEISKMVRGDKGTTVKVDVTRSQEQLQFSIVRDEIHSTAYGEIKGDIGYLEITSFGENTGDEVKKYLDYFKDNSIAKLLIDVRDNGGGYLTALEQIASYLLYKDQIILQQERVNGEINATYANGRRFDNFTKIGILVNQNSASASEVLTATLKENLNATVIGVKTYGKGTVQTTTPFVDGSALKVTVAQWLSPNGNKINKVGIQPDVEVKLHPVFYLEREEMAEDEIIMPDTVNSHLIFVQQALDFLGYPVDRFDGYYSAATESAVRQYFADNNIAHDTTIDQETLANFVAAVSITYTSNLQTYDVQLNKALELLK